MMDDCMYMLHILCNTAQVSRQCSSVSPHSPKFRLICPGAVAVNRCCSVCPFGWLGSLKFNLSRTSVNCEVRSLCVWYDYVVLSLCLFVCVLVLRFADLPSGWVRSEDDHIVPFFFQ